MTKKILLQYHKHFFWFFIAILCVVLSGCAKPTVDTALVEKFVPPVVPGEQETLVYVIRTNDNFIAGIYPLWVGLNDEVLAKLDSGSYCYFKTVADNNMIFLEFTARQIKAFRLYNRTGEIVFLYFDDKFQLTEIPKDLGITLVMQFAEKGLLPEPKKYPSAVINPIYLMKKSHTSLKPDNENAVITFFRPQSFLKDRAFGIWGRTGFLGNIKGKTYFEIKVPAGKHLFFGKAERFSVLQAEVEAGQRYCVLVTAKRGAIKPHIRLLPVTPERHHEIDKWTKESAKVELDKSIIYGNIQNLLDKGLKIYERVFQHVSEGKQDVRKLKPSDSFEYVNLEGGQS